MTFICSFVKHLTLSFFKIICENVVRCINVSIIDIMLMLERGTEVRHPDYPTANLDPWQLPNGGRLTEAARNRCHIQSRHYSYQADNQHFYINDLENPYVESKRFDWIRGDIVGGRSLLWARHCYRWSDLDFEANVKEGIGVDWPIRYKDIAPWYSYVERFIGVSGKSEGIAQLPDGVFLPPMEMNCAETDFSERLSRHFPDRKVTIGRVANATAPVKGRGICQYRNLCHRGCPFGAYFSTNAGTLPAAFATGNLTLKTQTLVNHVLYDEQKSRAIGVEVVDVRLKRVDLPQEVSESVYRRMEAERKRVANELRSTGAAESEKIRADADRQREVVLAEAYRDAQKVMGDGDSQAAAIYSAAFQKDSEFYAFWRIISMMTSRSPETTSWTVRLPNSSRKLALTVCAKRVCASDSSPRTLM